MMKFNLNLITLALIASASVTMVQNAHAAGYGIANANTATVKFDKWQCKKCPVETGTSGTIGIGAGYNDSDDIRSANAFGVEEEFAGKVDANMRYVSESGYRAKIEADNLGMQNGRMNLEMGKPGQYALSVNYRQIATYGSDKVMTPYSGVETDTLSLPSNWQTAGSSQQMALSSALNPFELSQKRRREGIGFSYSGGESAEVLWSAYVNYQHEQKTGVKSTTGSFYNQSMALPEPVDYDTNNVEAGLRFKGDNWLTVLNYSGSTFSNENSQLSFDNAFNPTFGAQTQGTLALSPDNEAHMVSLLGQYFTESTVYSGKLHYGQMTQDEAFVTSGYGYQLPAESLDGEVDISGVNLKAVSKLSSALRFTASYDYRDRDNKTQVQEWTQIRINNVNGKAEYNTPYDSTTHKAKLAANYRLARGMKLQGGYDYTKKERDYSDRETTDEHKLWAKFHLSSLEMWDLWLKGEFGQRDGSAYQASQWTSFENNSLLRKYHLADRDRTQVTAGITHTPTDALSLDLGLRYAMDDYDDTQIGLTESENMSVDASVNYMINKDVDLNLFYSMQNIESDQAGSNNFSTANWNANVEDSVDVVGLGLSYRNLMEDKLALGLDYTYSDSDSNTQVSQGLTGDYGEYFAKIHNLNLYAKYQATEKAAVRFDYKLENYQDNDSASDIAPDAIWNVVGFGSNSHDYKAHLFMISVSYQL